MTVLSDTIWSAQHHLLISIFHKILELCLIYCMRESVRRLNSQVNSYSTFYIINKKCLRQFDLWRKYWRLLIIYPSSPSVYFILLVQQELSFLLLFNEVNSLSDKHCITFHHSGKWNRIRADWLGLAWNGTVKQREPFGPMVEKRLLLHHKVAYCTTCHFGRLAST